MKSSRIACAALLGAAFVVSSASARETRQAAAASTGIEFKKPAEEKKLCRSMVETGSMMPRKTCRTKAEWKAIDARNQDNAEQALSQRRMGTPTQ